MLNCLLNSVWALGSVHSPCKVKRGLAVNSKAVGIGPSSPDFREYICQFPSMVASATSWTVPSSARSTEVFHLTGSIIWAES